MNMLRTASHTEFVSSGVVAIMFILYPSQLAAGNSAIVMFQVLSERNEGRVGVYIENSGHLNVVRKSLPNTEARSN